MFNMRLTGQRVHGKGGDYTGHGADHQRRGLMCINVGADSQHL
jgi:hypothetical protein